MGQGEEGERKGLAGVRGLGRPAGFRVSEFGVWGSGFRGVGAPWVIRQGKVYCRGVVRHFLENTTSLLFGVCTHTLEMRCAAANRPRQPPWMGTRDASVRHPIADSPGDVTAGPIAVFTGDSLTGESELKFPCTSRCGCVVPPSFPLTIK